MTTCFTKDSLVVTLCNVFIRLITQPTSEIDFVPSTISSSIMETKLGFLDLRSLSNCILRS